MAGARKQTRFLHDELLPEFEALSDNDTSNAESESESEVNESESDADEIGDSYKIDPPRDAAQHTEKTNCQSFVSVAEGEFCSTDS
jgi:U3 small nucleolar RNA-associated protein 14